jgi:peptidoglycan/xylan/chitin deacetylase (PgdA/CDA1 family)
MSIKKIFLKIEEKSRFYKFTIKNYIKKPIIILNYHQISDSFDSTTQDINIWTSLKDFENTILYFQNKGYEFIAAEEAINICGSNQKPKKRYISITFDDGHKSILNVLDIMNKHKVPVLFFINSAYIDDFEYNWVDIVQYFNRNPKDYYDKFNITIEDWDTLDKLKICKDNDSFLVLEKKAIVIVKKVNDFKNRHLTKIELNGLVDPLVTIGLHAHRHYKHDIMKDEVLHDNLVKDMEFLKDHPNYKPYFAFPFGRYKKTSLDVVKKLSIIPFFHRGGVNYFDDYQFGFKRIPVGNSMVDFNYLVKYSKELTVINHIFKFTKNMYFKIKKSNRQQ